MTRPPALRRRTLSLALALALVPAVGGLLSPLEADATAPPSGPWTVSWASQPPTGVSPTGRAYEPAISGDGRTVTYSATDRRNTSGSRFHDGLPRTFVRRSGASTSVRLVIGADRTQGDQGDLASCLNCAPTSSLSADGRRAAFVSRADNLVPGDTNELPDIFLRDRDTGAVRLVSHAAGGGPSDGLSDVPQISGDGRRVLFFSQATDLVDHPGPSAWYLYDSVTDTVAQVPGLALAQDPRMSADATRVVFQSDQPLVPSDTDGTVDTYLLDLATGAISLVGVSDAGDPLHGDLPRISADGTTVAFRGSTNPRRPSRTLTVYVRDLSTGHTTAVPQPRGAVPAEVELSGTGTRVATLLIAASRWVQVSDLTGHALYDSHPSPGAWAVAIDGPGRCVAYQTNYQEVAADLDNSTDVYTACGP